MHTLNDFFNEPKSMPFSLTLSITPNVTMTCVILHDFSITFENGGYMCGNLNHDFRGGTLCIKIGKGIGTGPPTLI